MDYKLWETEAQERWLGRLADEVAEAREDRLERQVRSDREVARLRVQLEKAERAEAELDRVTGAAITGPDGFEYHWLPGHGWCPGHPQTSGEAGPALLPAGNLDEARQGGEGPAGSSPELPADLINRAAQLALDEVPVIRDVMRFPDAVVTKMMLAAADPLIEHGRQQEREKWEARIEAATARQRKLSQAYRSAHNVLMLDPHRYAGDLLRSLLPEEGNGE